MFYIRPPSRIAIPAAVKPIGTHDAVKEEDLAVSRTSDAPPLAVPTVERRKHRDRRKSARDPLLETRTNKGKDRRQTTTPSISITV